MFRKLLLSQLLTVALVAFLDIYLGLNGSYFSKIWWFDIPLHILGGVWAGLWVATAGEFFSIRLSIWHIVLSVLLIGIGWEVFEYVFDMKGSAFMSYPVDTAKDLIADCIGGVIAVFITARLRSR